MSAYINILKNGVANVLTKSVKVLDQLILVPFFLSAWGAAYYGEWITLSVIPSVLAFSDLGFGSAASNSFVLSYSSGDKKRSFSIFTTALYIITGAILLGILLSIVAMTIANDTGILSKMLIEADDAIYALSLMIASRLFAFYNQLFEAMYRAKRKAHISTHLTNLDGIMRICSGILVLSLGYGIVEYAASQFIVAIMFNIVYAFLAIRTLGEDPRGAFSTHYSKEIMIKGMGFMMTPVWQSIYFQGSTFVVRVVLGAESVAIFNTVRTVCRSVNQMYSVVNNSIFPELQFALGCGDTNMVHRIFRNSLWLVLALSFIGVLGLSLFGQELYNWWTHNELCVPDSMWSIFLIGICFNAVWWTAACTFRAVNKPYRFAIYGLFSAIISTGISYPLAIHYGLTGATIGYVVMDVLMSILVLPTAIKLLNMTWRDLLPKQN